MIVTRSRRSIAPPPKRDARRRLRSGNILRTNRVKNRALQVDQSAARSLWSRLTSRPTTLIRLSPNERMNDTDRYKIVRYRPGSPDPVFESTANTLRAARSLAYRRALKVSRAPIWVAGGKAWNSELAVGGYDAKTGRGEYTGEAACVVERMHRNR